MIIEASGIGLAAAFAAGLVSFVSPCVLPLVPTYVWYVAGQAGAAAAERDAYARFTALAMSAFFVLGFSTIFITLGASATVLGRLLLQYRYEANLIGGSIVILFGLLMLGFDRLIPWLQHDVRFHPGLRGGRPFASYLLGLAFGFGWTPCIGLILGAILALSAVQTSVQAGVGLLAVYAARLGVAEAAAARGRWLQYGAGGIMALMGLAMVTGQLSRFSFWLLNIFPVFGRIG